jgi:hypothetical protein
MKLHLSNENSVIRLHPSDNRYPHFALLPRIWQLRHKLSAYDAAYVALAEELGPILLNERCPPRVCFSHTAQIHGIVTCRCRIQIRKWREMQTRLLKGSVPAPSQQDTAQEFPNLLSSPHR